MVEFSEFTRTALRNKFKSKFPDADFEAIDWAGNWVSTLHIAENMEEICKKFNLIQVQYNKGQEKAIVQERLEQETEHTHTARSQAIANLQSIKGDTIDSCFFSLIESIKATYYSPYLAGLIIQGSAGIGKTHMAFQTLNELCLKEGEDFTYLNGYATTLALYNELYKNNDKKVIIIDDVPNVFKDAKAVAILKGCLSGIGSAGQQKRIVHYLSTSKDRDAPQMFEIKAKIIFLTNAMGNNPELSSLKDRCLFLNLQLSYDERFKILCEYAKKQTILPVPDAIEVLDWLKDKVCEGLEEQLNFRTLQQLFCLKLTGSRWKELALTQLDIDEHKVWVVDCFKEAVRLNTKVEEQVKHFCSATGLSRRTFFLTKKNLK